MHIKFNLYGERLLFIHYHYKLPFNPTVLSLLVPEELVDGDGHGLGDGLHAHAHPLGVLRLVLAGARQQLLRLHARQVRRRRTGLVQGQREVSAVRMSTHRLRGDRSVKTNPTSTMVDFQQMVNSPKTDWPNFDSTISQLIRKPINQCHG